MTFTWNDLLKEISRLTDTERSAPVIIGTITGAEYGFSLQKDDIPDYGGTVHLIECCK